MTGSAAYDQDDAGAGLPIDQDEAGAAAEAEEAVTAAVATAVRARARAASVRRTAGSFDSNSTATTGRDGAAGPEPGGQTVADEGRSVDHIQPRAGRPNLEA